MRTSRTSTSTTTSTGSFIPHQGALCRVDDEERCFVVEILITLHDRNSTTTSSGGGVSYHHELAYTRKDFLFAQRLFHILDTESIGLIDRETVKEFVVLRCPVFWRRDDDLKRLGDSSSSSSPTFDEIWQSVVVCCNNNVRGEAASVKELGVEGFMVFCRFLSLAQYLEAKRRFSARHLQQTMRQRNSPRGSELIVVDVPPLDPPAHLSPLQLATYERKSKAPLPLPELDLDHSLVAAHDAMRSGPLGTRLGSAKICLFGSQSSFSNGLLNGSNGLTATSTKNLEFAVTFTKRRDPTLLSASSQQEEVVTRRSMQDMKWLNATFDSHKVLGGTLCGRILPPFPSAPSTSVLTHFQQEIDDSSFSVKSTSGAISAAASAGVGKLRDAAKSFRSYLGTGPQLADESNNVPSAPQKKQANTNTGIHRALSDSYYNPNSPAGRARHLERYLNYLLEHPALSTSFPLNTILKGSQSGLEAAKEMLEMCDRARKEMNAQTPQLDDGKARILSTTPNFAWVRTAAQAAMALHVHGMLETGGMPSASARLQHASLPVLSSVRSWVDDDGRAGDFSQSCYGRRNADDEEEEGSNFEEGVISVQSELQSTPTDLFSPDTDDDYDLLPLPVPAPERRILCEGSGAGSAGIHREARFHYGGTSPQNSFHLDDDDKGPKSGFLSDMAVDENIDKLREVIGSVDNTLSRCLASSGAIGRAQRERQSLHLDVVRGLDSWAGMRGKFVSQRSLLKGVAGIEQSSDLYEEGYIAIIDDLSWQTSLAHSAVAAAEDVRSSVRASRVAANAKAAASSAAMTAQTACETGNFGSIDEARAAQTRASIAQSHAIHAAVVEHEAKTVKRRATLALANDVKVWNVHRKREMLHSCIAFARSQHEGTRRAVDAWSSLRDGFVGSTMIPVSHERQRNTSRQSSSIASVFDQNEATSTIYEAEATIVAVEHSLLASTSASCAPDSFDELDKAATESCVVSPPQYALETDDDLVLPFATASPVIELGDDELTVSNRTPKKNPLSYSKDPEGDFETQNKEEAMSASMQSLVDGLMTWGGGFDTEEDHLALPPGMATSIIMEDRMIG